MTGVTIMKLIEMKSPHGSDTMSIHPSKLSSYENRGWTRVEPVADKSKRKRKTGGVKNG